MARRRGALPSRLMRLAAALALLLIVAALSGWWYLRGWMPSRAAYPSQGAEVGIDDGEVDWTALKAVGADFVYLDASASAFARDGAFVKNLEAARDAGLRVGAVHLFDPCQPADRQASNFVTVVPRDARMLPAAVDLDRLADDCPTRVSDAAVTSELMTFLNQVETHTGQPAILKVTRRFEARYHVARGFNRDLWLVQPRLEPGYAKRPWALWTANDRLVTEAHDLPLRWVVAQP